MCDCLDKVNKVLREELGDNTAGIEVSLTLVDNRLEAVPSMSVLYHPKKKDGTLSEREKSMGVRPTFCPFCGVRYIPDGQVGEDEQKVGPHCYPWDMPLTNAESTARFLRAKELGSSAQMIEYLVARVRRAEGKLGKQGEEATS